MPDASQYITQKRAGAVAEGHRLSPNAKRLPQDASSYSFQQEANAIVYSPLVSVKSRVAITPTIQAILRRSVRT